VSIAASAGERGAERGRKATVVWSGNRVSALGGRVPELASVEQAFG
jgi:hypothetical protein